MIHESLHQSETNAMLSRSVSDCHEQQQHFVSFFFAYTPMWWPGLGYGLGQTATNMLVRQTENGRLAMGLVQPRIGCLPRRKCVLHSSHHVFKPSSQHFMHILGAKHSRDPLSREVRGRTKAEDKETHRENAPKAIIASIGNIPARTRSLRLVLGSPGERIAGPSGMLMPTTESAKRRVK